VTAASRLVTMAAGGDRPACLLLPGVGGSPGQYLDLAGRLAGRFGVYALRAAGLVEGEPAETSVRQMAGSALAALDQAGLRPDLVLGWSFGGVLGWELCVRLAARGRSPRLVLLDSSPFRRRATPAADRAIGLRISSMLGAVPATVAHRVAALVAVQLAAMANHQPAQTYSGPTLALACTDEEFGDRSRELARWAELAPRLVTGRLAAGHFEALRADRIDELVGRLDPFLAAGLLAGEPAAAGPPTVGAPG